MIRAPLFLIALLLFSSRSHALEYVEVWDETGASLFRLPGDSVLVFDSMGTQAELGDPVARVHLEKAPSHGGKTTLQRMTLTWAIPGIWRFCLGDAAASCLVPQSIRKVSLLDSVGFANTCSYSTTAWDRIEGEWDRGHALDSLKRTMSQNFDRRLYRFDTLRTVWLPIAEAGDRSVLKTELLSSPWTVRDRLYFGQQWIWADSTWPGHEGERDSLHLTGSETWWAADTGWFDSLRLEGRFYGSVRCHEQSPLWKRSGHGLLRTNSAEFEVVNDTLYLDTLVKSSAWGAPPTYYRLSDWRRARIALTDLDSLLGRRDLAIGGRGKSPVSVRIESGQALLDAGSLGGRLELFDGRGRLLSRMSGQGTLRLSLVGHGARLIRWGKGNENGALPVPPVMEVAR